MQKNHVAVINNAQIDLWKTLTMHRDFIRSQSNLVQDDVVEAWNWRRSLYAI